VGKSGSPMPNEMTSTPWARFSAIFLLISAKRYGGRVSIRWEKSKRSSGSVSVVGKSYRMERG